MTVVIGALTNYDVILASDGYALYQAEHGEQTCKIDTYSKVKLFPDQNIALGFAGSHEVSLKFFNECGPYNVLEEANFLQTIAFDLKTINEIDANRKCAAIIGYLFNGTPRIALLPKEGGYEIQEEICAVGAGADVAVDYLAKHWKKDINISDAISVLVETIYSASIVPTVNFLPMIVVLRKGTALDLSSVTVTAFSDFKKQLKESLSKKVTFI